MQQSFIVLYILIIETNMCAQKTNQFTILLDPRNVLMHAIFLHMRKDGLSQKEIFNNRK